MRPRAHERLLAVPRRALTRLSRADRLALFLLVLAPVLVYVPFSLAGHPLVPGDDLTQNYPLRVLAGSVLRGGHLPSWDPYVWSGTPLLAGWNAGALYPGTWLFAVLPGIAAWTINLVSVGVVAATGLYVLLRMLACGPLAACLASLAYADAGFLSGQLSHLGLVEGTGYTAWMLVALELLARRSSWRARIGPVVGLALAVALCILAGEPRAISSAVLVAVVYLAALAWRSGWHRSPRLVAGAAAGAGLGTALAAVQWLPGLANVARSQRGLAAYEAFGVGSLHLANVAQDLLVPFLLGGNGNFGLPHFQGSLNLPEQTIGMGVLPLVAACAYLPSLARALRRTRRDDGARGRALGVWYVLGALGLVLTMGTTTPLGHLLVHVPLYGGERLQNRNALLLDLALAVLLGFLVDDLVRRRRAPLEDARAASAPLGTRTRRLLGVLPVLGVVALIGLAYLHPLGLEFHLEVAHRSASLFRRLSPYLVATLVVAVAIGCFVLAAPRLSRRVRASLVSVLVLADTAMFAANALYSTAPSAALAGQTSASARLGALVGDGRFAIFNPLVRDVYDGRALGEPDLNILRGLASVQGYGSIVDGRYQDATDTHDLESLDPAIVHDGLGDALDLRVVLTQANYLATPLEAGEAIPVAGGPPTMLDGGSPPSGVRAHAPLLQSGPWTLSSGTTQTWFLPSTEAVRDLTVILDASPRARPSRLEVALGRPGGPLRFTSVRVLDGRVHLALGVPERAETVAVRVPDRSAAAARIGAVVVSAGAPARAQLLDGALQGALVAPQWSFAGVLGVYRVFVNHAPTPLSWLEPTTARSASVTLRAAGTVATTLGSAGGSPRTSVTAPHAALLVRSVAYEPGWTAELTPVGSGPTRALSVEPLGLLQSVHVPAGRYVLTWHYAPRALVLGAVLSGSGVGLLALVGLFGSLDARGARRARLGRSTRRGRPST